VFYYRNLSYGFPFEVIAIKCAEYFLPNVVQMGQINLISKSLNMGWVCSTHVENNEYRMLVAKPEGKRPLGILRRRWEDSIRMDLGEIGWGGMDWIHLTQDIDQWEDSCGHCNEPSGSIKLKFLSS
jgi:hypothetical protein